MSHQFPLVRLLQKPFEPVSGIAPDGFEAVVTDSGSKFRKPLCLHHGVAAREGDIGELVVHDLSEQFVGGHPVAMVDVPRLWVVAAGAGIVATGTIDGGPKSRTVNHCILDDVKYGDHDIYNKVYAAGLQTVEE